MIMRQSRKIYFARKVRTPNKRRVFGALCNGEQDQLILTESVTENNRQQW